MPPSSGWPYEGLVWSAGVGLRCDRSKNNDSQKFDSRALEIMAKKFDAGEHLFSEVKYLPKRLLASSSNFME